jgi:hypothetical protein
MDTEFKRKKREARVKDKVHALTRPEEGAANEMSHEEVGEREAFLLCLTVPLWCQRDSELCAGRLRRPPSPSPWPQYTKEGIDAIYRLLWEKLHKVDIPPRREGRCGVPWYCASEPLSRPALHQENIENVRFLELVINPQSYSQSVENIFHLGFLVNRGAVSLWLDDDGEAWISALFIRVT